MYSLKAELINQPLTLALPCFLYGEIIQEKGVFFFAVVFDVFFPFKATIET